MATPVNEQSKSKVAAEAVAVAAAAEVELGHSHSHSEGPNFATAADEASESVASHDPSQAAQVIGGSGTALLPTHHVESNGPPFLAARAAGGGGDGVEATDDEEGNVASSAATDDEVAAGAASPEYVGGTPEDPSPTSEVNAGIAADPAVDVDGSPPYSADPNGAEAGSVKEPPPQESPQPHPHQRHPKLPGKVSLRIASQIEDRASRDRYLVEAMRDCREELEDAEAANAEAANRLAAAREAYDLCARLLAGYTPLETRLRKKRGPAAGGIGDRGDEVLVGGAKRVARDSSAADGDVNAITRPEGAVVVAELAAATRARGQVQTEGEDVVLPVNDIYLPEYFSSGGGMLEDAVASFRDAFYLRLTRGQSGAATIDSWRPPPNNANLKSKAQLAEWIHIAANWNTGADGLDAGAFRAKHKTWYSRMKPVSYNLGRRTGIHLRQLDVDEGEAGDHARCLTVLCRYNKAGNKSTVYLDVGRLFDALFEIHALELGHRGRDATKNLADERYANIPDATVRAFLETCPVCSARRGQGPMAIPAVPTHLLPASSV